MAKQEPPKQMRITDETMEQIRAIAQEIGGTQQDVMTHLLRLHQAEQAKDQLPDRAKDIEQYKTYMDAAMQMYLSVLEDSASIADATKTKYSGLIDTLQRQVSDFRIRCADADRQVKESKAAEEAAKNRVGELESRLADQVRIITGLEQQIADMQADVEAAKTFNAEKQQLEQKVHALEDQVRQLQASMDAAAAAHAQELWGMKRAHQEQMLESATAHQEQMLKINTAHQMELAQAQDEYQRQIRQYQKEYMDLLQQFRTETTAQLHAGQVASPSADPDQQSLDD